MTTGEQKTTHIPVVTNPPYFQTILAMISGVSLQELTLQVCTLLKLCIVSCDCLAISCDTGTEGINVIEAYDEENGTVILQKPVSAGLY